MVSTSKTSKIIFMLDGASMIQLLPEKINCTSWEAGGAKGLCYRVKDNPVKRTIVETIFL